MKTVISSVTFLLMSQSFSNGKILVDVEAGQVPARGKVFGEIKPVLMRVWLAWFVPCIEVSSYLMMVTKNHEGQFKAIYASGVLSRAREKTVELLKKRSVDFGTNFKAGKYNELLTTISNDRTAALSYATVYNKKKR
jgi:hypothetical protein